MKKLTVLHKVDPVNDNDILNIEEKYKISIPDYVKEFINNYGGTETQEKTFNSGDKKYRINFFLAVVSDNNASIDLILPAVHDPEDIGRTDLIPFAIDAGGKPYYVSIGDSDNGVVYIDNVGRGGEVLKNVSDSFETFIENLKGD